MGKCFYLKKIGACLFCGCLLFFVIVGNTNAEAQLSTETSQGTDQTNNINQAIASSEAATPEQEALFAEANNEQQMQIESTNAYDNTQGNLWDEIPYFFQLPDYTNRPEVVAQIKWFQKHQKYFNHLLEQATPYIYYVYEQARKRNLPAELVIVPMIESEYNSFDYSNKGAYGFWQLMPGTASGLGLKGNWWYEARSDLAASTNAALNFLTDLDTQFNNDWLLAFASYNCGPVAVQRAIENNIRNGLPTDVWSLKLPHETKLYVPKFLAIEAIIRAPDHYGLTLYPINNAPYIKVVKLTSQIDLKQVAIMAGVSEKTLRKLNPGLLRWATNPEATYNLMLPITNADMFEKNLAKLPKENRVTWHIHKVTTGETIKSLANKYNTTPNTLIKVNHLPSDKIHSQQRLLIPINAKNTDNITIPDKLPQPQATHSSSPNKHKIRYTVKPKDTLAKIAANYGVTQKQIRSWNNLKPNPKLKSQQKLTIWVPTKAKQKPHRRH
jgi:membrane-bound lytic murein transglycosylase D